MSTFSMPFVERYDWLRRALLDARERLATHELHVEAAKQDLVTLEAQWLAMVTYDGDQVEAVERHRASVHEALKAAGWFQPASTPSAPDDASAGAPADEGA